MLNITLESCCEKKFRMCYCEIHWKCCFENHIDVSLHFSSFSNLTVMNVLQLSRGTIIYPDEIIYRGPKLCSRSANYMAQHRPPFFSPTLLAYQQHNLFHFLITELRFKSSASQLIKLVFCSTTPLFINSRLLNSDTKSLSS